MRKDLLFTLSCNLFFTNVKFKYYDDIDIFKGNYRTNCVFLDTPTSLNKS